MKSNNKIILVQPDYPTSPFKDLFFPVGLGYLAEILEINGKEYEVSDLNVETRVKLFEKIKKINPGYVGLSLMSLDIFFHYRLIEDIKKNFPEVKIIAGGPHISFSREQALKECPSIDYGVVHEGEQTLVELLSDSSVETIKGLIYRNPSNEIVFNGERGFIENLNIVDFPKYNRFDYSKYGAYVSIASSRGCPFSCTFCGAFISMGKKWRARSEKNLFDEILYWYEKGYRHFNFVDSNFFLSHKRVIELCKLLEENNIKINMNSDGFRASDANYEMLSTLKRFGLSKVALGIESANDDILINIKKGITLDQINKCLEMLRSLNISVVGFFIIGLPGETFGHVMNSFKFALANPIISSAYFFNPNPLPKTELFEWAKHNKFLRTSNMENIYYNMGGMGKDILIETPELTFRKRKILYLISKLISLMVSVKYNTSKELGKIRGYVPFRKSQAGRT